MLRSAVVLLILVGCGAAHAASTTPPTIELDVTADDGLTCHAYLTPAATRATTLILWLDGTGTGSSARIPDELHRPGVALVTFDRPGVRAPFGDPGAVRIADASFARYTQGTLLSCARQVLATALERVSQRAPINIILRGHSEGTLIVLALIESSLPRSRHESARSC